MKGKTKPGTRAGIPNATPEQVEAGLAAWVASGSSRIAALKTGWSDDVIRHWKQRHPETWAKVSHAFATELAEVRLSRVRDADDAMHAGAQALGRVIAEGSLDTKDLASAVRALETVAAFYDRVGRLDSGRPTEIQETRDATPDDQLRAEVEAMLRDPKTRAALAGVKP